MSAAKMLKLFGPGSYRVKAAESPWARPAARPSPSPSLLTEADRKLAHAVAATTSPGEKR